MGHNDGNRVTKRGHCTLRFLPANNAATCLVVFGTYEPTTINPPVVVVAAPMVVPDVDDDVVAAMAFCCAERSSLADNRFLVSKPARLATNEAAVR